MITPVFVDQFPEKLQGGLLYISQKYQIANHLCACGCGMETVTPLHKGEWNLEIVGKEVTLSPSIGNFKIPCKSHYYIRSNKIVWC